MRKMNLHITPQSKKHSRPTRPHLIGLFLFLGLAFGTLRAAEYTTRIQDGYTVLGIENEFWRIEVVQGLGGKLISLNDRISDREWLWSRNKTRNLTRPSSEANFGTGNTIGWDELFPNLRKSVWQKRELKGHGLLWQADVKIDEKALKEGHIHSSVDFEALSIRYEREISLNGAELELRYRIKNTGDKPFPYLWAMHPLFSIHPGDELSADLHGEEFRVEGAPGIPNIKKNSRIVWPGKAFGIDLEKLFLGQVPKAGIKLFIQSPDDGTISLKNPETGAGLSIHYDTGTLPSLAIWMSRGVWGNAHHIAIEPTNRPNELVSEKTPEEDPAGWILPGEVREWEVRIENNSR